MPAITALVHARNDALRLGRALETLLPCDEILVIDHHSADATARVARDYGSRVITARDTANPSEYLQLATHEWILCLEPRESLTEGLTASLFEWKSQPQSHSDAQAFSFRLRDETNEGWRKNPEPQTRLVPRNWSRWQGLLPASETSATLLEGTLLRFILP